MACRCGKVRSCKECQTRYNRKWYRENREEQVRKAAERRKRVREEARDYLITAKSNPCTDCGNSFHWFAMDFDHVGDKVADIHQMVRRGFPLARIREEISKCELVCAVCHRLRTWNRLGPSGAVDSAPVS